jgi:hypothetical protein
MEKAASGSRPFLFFVAALQTAGDSSRPDSVLHLLHAARRQSGLAAHFYGLPSLRSKPLEILLDLTAFRTCYTPLATNRGSRRISMDCGRYAAKASAGNAFRFKAKLLEVLGVGGFSLGQNGHGFTVGLRPNPGKQGVDANEAF